MVISSARETQEPALRGPSLMTPIIPGSISLPRSSASEHEELRYKLKMEYSGNIYRSNNLFQKIYTCCLSSAQFSDVMDDCIKRFELLPQFPLSTIERDHYPPFVARLNAVKKSLEQHELMNDSIYQHSVRFETYNHAALKPGILARMAPSSAEEDASWQDVEFCVEAKNEYADMVVQGATYARSISYAQRSRHFVLIIFYEHTKHLVTFGLFTSAFLCLSWKGHNLQNDQGRRGFIRDMAQIWSCNDRWSAGFDMTCNNVLCYLGPKHGTFSYNEKICYRVSLRGPRTRVDVIRSGDVEKDKYILRAEEPGASQVPESARVARTTAKSQVSSPCNLPVPYEKPKHVKLILKDSWQLVSQENREIDVWKDITTKFGVCEILDCFSVMGDGKRVSVTSLVFPDDAKRYNRLLKDMLRPYTSGSQTRQGSEPSDSEVDKEHKPEHRVHVRLLIRTEGVLLEHAESPRALVQAVLHAMIGYWEMFKNGWLHRDVSYGNVLLMKKPERRDRIEGLDDVLTEEVCIKHFEKCTGFINDGDLAVKWGDMNRKVARQRSGTPPFMSCQLLRGMTRNTDYFHSAIDDLESFIWVLFWAIFTIMERHHLEFTSTEREYWSVLQSRNLVDLSTKRSFPDTLLIQKRALADGRELAEVPLSPTFAPFVNLLFDWLRMVFSHDPNLVIIPSKPPSVHQYETIVKSLIERYLKIGLEHLVQLPDTWEAKV